MNEHTQPSPREPREIAFTSKRLKAESVAAGVVFWLAALVAVAGPGVGQLNGIPGLIAGLAFAWWLSVRVRRWWRHD